MTTRLATEADIPLLDTMLTNMEQRKSEAAIREMLAAPYIAVIHETAGAPDGFYFFTEGGLTQPSLLGPGDGPHESLRAWVKAICEMGQFIDQERQRRHPTWDLNATEIITRIWTKNLALRTYIEQQFNWKKRTKPTAEGYDEVGTMREYHIKRSTLMASVADVLTRLG